VVLDWSFFGQLMWTAPAKAGRLAACVFKYVIVGIAMIPCE